MNTEYSLHPFDPFIPKGATLLIIGSIPPTRFCGPNKNLMRDDVDFYYGSSDNAFWDLIGKATRQEFTKQNIPTAVKERKDALVRMGVGITDIVAKCKRKNGSASDNSLYSIERKPLRSLLDQYPAIHTILYTSSFVKSQVGRELDQYHRSTDRPRVWRLPIGKKEYTAVVLYSPSPQALRNLGANGSDRRLIQYKAYFG
ncbi:MAG TPA: hypothetical protein PKN30_13230 [Flavobacteriales bacterium]|nr:hypothetical protein [Flavobacteriales bacterium]